MKAATKVNNALPIERLRAAYRYDEATGQLWWRQRFSNACKMDSPIGTLSARGYLVCRLDDHLMYVHRIVWAIVTGAWPPDCLDHLDGNPLNNRMENLRLAFKQENLRNRRMDGRNRSGVKGVSWDKSKRKWVAVVGHDRKHHFVGRYSSLEEAAAARRRVAMELHGEFYRPA